jgi:hypothetical protein
MGTATVYKCNVCGHEVRNSGPWEFYRDAKGRRKQYGHPCPNSKEAEERGVYGFTYEVYCFDCDKTSEIILIEFKKPSFSSLEWWSMRCEPKEEYKKRDKIRCPICKGDNLIINKAENAKMLCPKCKKGELKSLLIIQT